MACVAKGIDIKCTRCNEPGHVAKACPNKPYFCRQTVAERRSKAANRRSQWLARQEENTKKASTWEAKRPGREAELKDSDVASNSTDSTTASTSFVVDQVRMGKGKGKGKDRGKGNGKGNAVKEPGSQGKSQGQAEGKDKHKDHESEHPKGKGKTGKGKGKFMEEVAPKGKGNQGSKSNSKGYSMYKSHAPPSKGKKGSKGSKSSPRAEIEELVELTVCRLNGIDVQVQTFLSDTVQDFKKTLRTRSVVQGLSAFKLLMDDGTLLRDGSATLSDCGLRDGSILTIVMGRARDYTMIDRFDHMSRIVDWPWKALTNEHGELFVCHLRHNEPAGLNVYGADYSLLREHTLPVSNLPSDMTFAPSGELLIGFLGHPIGVFDPMDMKLLRWLGDARHYTGVAMSGDLVFATDRRLNVLIVFSFSTGKLVDTWTSCSMPRFLAVVEDQYLAVTDFGRRCVRLLNFAGGVVTDIGIGSLRYPPDDVAVDADGNILVIDAGNKRIAVYDKDGMFLASVMKGSLKYRRPGEHGPFYSGLISVNQVTGVISATFLEDSLVVILDPPSRFREERAVFRSADWNQIGA